MNSLAEGFITIILMIGGIAFASVLVSRKANTAGVAQSLFSGIGNDIAVAQSPVTNSSVSINLGYPPEASSYQG